MKLNNASAKTLKKLRECIRTEIGPVISQVPEVSSDPKSPCRQKLGRTAGSFSLVEANGSRIVGKTQSQITIASPRKMKHLQKEIETQRHSIKFYLTELNRKQTIYRDKIEKYQQDCSQQVQNLENLIKVESRKNRVTEKEIETEKNSSTKFGAIYNSLDNKELFQLYEDIRYQLYKRGVKHNEQSNTTQSQSEIRRVKLFGKESSFSLDGVSNITQ